MRALTQCLSKGLRAFSAEEFELIANETGALILDTREASNFGKGFIPNSINIGIDGSFAPWVGSLIPGVAQPLLVIADKGREEEVVTRLARVGFDNTLGYLRNGFKSWLQAGKEIDTIENVSASEFASRFKKEKLFIIDVRKPGEFQAEHIEGAVNIPLDFINNHLAEVPKTGQVYLHCAGGYRSMIAASMLKARGWDNLININDGMKAITATDVPCTNYVCTKTLLQNSNK